MSVIHNANPKEKTKMLKFNSTRPNMIFSIATAGLLCFGGFAHAQECPASKLQTAETAIHLVAYQDPAQPADIVDTAAGAGDFTTLVAAVKAAGLVDTLKGKGPFTVFAPSDEAFGKIPASDIDELLKPKNKEKLTAILTNHVVSGKIMAADAKGADSVETVGGGTLKVAVEDETVMIGDAKVVAADIACANGVIHVIDTVLMPGDKDSDGAQSATETKKDIVDTAVANGSFKTLVAAVKAGDLVETLKGEGPFTVFAPNDDAFAKVPEATLAELLKPESKEKLQGILTYHVVKGNVMAADVVELESATTVNGQTVAIKTEDGNVMVGSSKVIATDIECSNGVIHVIDSVLMPK